MRSLIEAVKFCTLLLIIGTSLGQLQNGQPELPPIQVTTISLQPPKLGDKNETDASEGLAQQGLKVVQQLLDPAANLANDIGQWVLNVSSAVKKGAVEVGKEAIQAGTELEGTVFQFVSNVTDLATDTLGWTDSGNTLTEGTVKQIISV
uniref:Hypothetical secreted protein n=1 Tax=Triatoma matogrossensis TaxID=162370 RepID=E2J7B4_9HEMI